MNQPNVFDKIQSNVVLPMFNIFGEIIRLFPDSLLFGSFFLYFLTLNKSLGVFSLFMTETMILNSLIGTAFSMIYGPSSPRSLECQSGFRAPRLEVERIFLGDTYPSKNILSLYSVATYILSSTLSFQETLNTMGPDWSAHVNFSIAFIVILTLSMTLIRFLKGCESLTEILIAMFIGTIIGILLFTVNKAMFGPEGVNFLGLPYLVDKSQKGSEIYVCTKTQAK